MCLKTKNKPRENITSGQEQKEIQENLKSKIGTSRCENRKSIKSGFS